MVFSWQMAEELAAAHMRSMGFTDARRTPDGADGGIDVRGGDAVAQVKYVTAPVGSPDIQRLRGAAHGAKRALFYSSSGYSLAARGVADACEIALFEYAVDNSVTAVNSEAHSLEAAESSRHSLRLTAEQAEEASLIWQRTVATGGAIHKMLNEVLEGERPPWPGMGEDVTSVRTFLSASKAERWFEQFEEALAAEDIPLALSIAKASETKWEQLLEAVNIDRAALEVMLASGEGD